MIARAPNPAAGILKSRQSLFNILESILSLATVVVVPRIFDTRSILLRSVGTDDWLTAVALVGKKIPQLAF